MRISEMHSNYFNGFQEISNYSKNDLKTNALAVIKIFSYATIVIPAAMSLLNCVSSLCGRVSKKNKFSNTDEKVKNKASETLNPVKAEKQPSVVSDKWGEIKLNINGVEQTFKDVVIAPSSDGYVAASWDWKWDKQDGMSHSPGVRIKDVDELIFKHSVPDVVILSKGRGHGGKRDNGGADAGVLKICPDVEAHIKSKGVKEVYLLKSLAAIEKYTELQTEGTKKVAALIHTTC